MNSITIPAIKSLTTTNKYIDNSLNKDTITVGSDGKYDYYSFLFWDISSIPSNAIISSAKLTLFKVDNFVYDSNKKISISPLTEYFSTYSTYSNFPNYDRYTVINFYPFTTKVSVTVDIATIVSSWVKSSLKNKGIILYSKHECSLASFGSVKSSNEYLVPFMTINYEPYIPNKCCKKKYNDKFTEDEYCEKYIKICKKDFEGFIVKTCKEVCRNNYNPCHPIFPIPPIPPTPPIPPITRTVRVIGVVAPQSIYYMVVDLQVIRASSGAINNYYVSDEYDNSLNNSSLSIDKTYNIAVSPPIQPNDTEDAILYGSYKGF